MWLCFIAFTTGDQTARFEQNRLSFLETFVILFCHWSWPCTCFPANPLLNLLYYLLDSFMVYRVFGSVQTGASYIYSCCISRLHHATVWLRQQTVQSVCSLFGSSIRRTTRLTNYCWYDGYVSWMTYCVCCSHSEILANLIASTFDLCQRFIHDSSNTLQR